MGTTFNLADLIPEQMTFRDADGKTYEALPAEMFGAAGYAKLTRLRTEMQAAFSALQSKQALVDPPDRTEQLAAQLEGVADMLIAMIVPDLPPERLRAIAFGHKFRFLNWWKEQQQVKAAPVGEAPAGESKKVIRGRRSPALSDSTVSTPKVS